MAVILPDNLKTLSIGDIVHIYVAWNGTIYYDDDGEVIEFSPQTGLSTVKFLHPKNNVNTIQIGVWAITKIVTESVDIPVDPQVAVLKAENEKLLITLKSVMDKLHAIIADVSHEK